MKSKIDAAYSEISNKIDALLDMAEREDQTFVNLTEELSNKECNLKYSKGSYSIEDSFMDKKLVSSGQKAAALTEDWENFINACKKDILKASEKNAKKIQSLNTLKKNLRSHISIKITIEGKEGKETKKVTIHWAEFKQFQKALA